MADPEFLFRNCTKDSHGIEYHDVESTACKQRLRGFCLTATSENMGGMSVTLLSLD